MDDKQKVSAILTVILTALVALLAVFGYDVKVIQPREAVLSAARPPACRRRRARDNQLQRPAGRRGDDERRSDGRRAADPRLESVDADGWAAGSTGLLDVPVKLDGGRLDDAGGAKRPRPGALSLRRRCEHDHRQRHEYPLDRRQRGDARAVRHRRVHVERRRVDPRGQVGRQLGGVTWILERSNCRGFRVDDAGKVVGVELVHVPNPATPYELARVELLDEYAAGGGTVAKFQVLADGVVTGERVYLAWPFPELSNRLLPGNPNGEHMITNGYDAAKGHRGPLALYVGDAAGGVISDVIGGARAAEQPARVVPGDVPGASRVRRRVRAMTRRPCSGWLPRSRALMARSGCWSSTLAREADSGCGSFRGWRRPSGNGVTEEMGDRRSHMTLAELRALLRLTLADVGRLAGRQAGWLDRPGHPALFGPLPPPLASHAGPHHRPAGL